MDSRISRVLASIVLLGLLACGPVIETRVDRGDRGPRQEEASRGPKRIKALVMGELPTLVSAFDRIVPGADTVQLWWPEG